jgi:hypothetical protein
VELRADRAKHRVRRPLEASIDKSHRFAVELRHQRDAHAPLRMLFSGAVAPRNGVETWNHEAAGIEWRVMLGAVQEGEGDAVGVRCRGGSDGRDHNSM